MTWETRLTTTISFNRATYDSYYRVESDLEDINDSIDFFTKKLQNLACITEPKKFCEEDQDPMWWLQHQVEECLEELSDLYVQRFKLNCLKEDWETCHTKEGEPIHPPKEFCNGKYGDCAYIDGDFILTKEERENFQ